MVWIGLWAVACAVRAPVVADSDPDVDSDTDSDTGPCIGTFGDNCGCVRQCVPRGLDTADTGSVCDLDCGPVTWTCDLVDGACVVH